MKTNFLKISAALALTGVLSACVVAPPQPMGYRMTSNVLPTYVNGQYVGMQPSNYMVPDTAAQQVAPTTAAVPQQPVYIQSTTPSVVYMQAPAPVSYYAPAYYSYDAYPSYSPFYASPWIGGLGIGLGIGLGFGGYGGYGGYGGWDHGYGGWDHGHGGWDHGHGGWDHGHGGGGYGGGGHLGGGHAGGGRGR